MIVKFKKLVPEAITPIYQGGFGYSCAFDLHAVAKDVYADYVKYGTGLAFEIPTGYCGLVLPRSSIYKKNFVLTNSVGLIDSQYRGEIIFNFKIIRDPTDHRWINTYELRDRIGQLLIIETPVVTLEETELTETKRGTHGFGNSGN